MAKLFQIAIFMAAALGIVGAHDILLGVYYGLDANNLPPPPRVVQLCKKYNIGRIRLYEPNIDVLEAFRGMGIDVSFGVPNSELMNMATNNSAVNQWFDTYVKPFIGDFTINYIVVGDKAVPSMDDCILPVMKSLQNLLNANNLGQVKLTTLVGYQSALAVRDPPSAGAFDPTARDNMKAILKFLSEQGSPLMISVYPYRKYESESNMNLSYAQFGKTEPVVRDGPLSYDNLFDAMVDAFYAANEREGVGDVAIAVGETGWPTCGNGNATTPELAGEYNQNVVRHLTSGKGTPRQPNVYLEGFIQSMFNENQKPEGDSQCYGVFDVNLNPVYSLFTLKSYNTANADGN